MWSAGVCIALGSPIINVSSVGGRMAFPLGTLYHGTKFAVEGLSESVYYELGALGMKIVEPGGMTTDFGGRSLDFSNDTELKEYQPLVQKVLDVLGPMMGEWIRTRADRRSHLLRGDGRNRPTAARLVQTRCRCSSSDARPMTPASSPE